MEIIDCTTFSSESGLFGPRMGIVGTEKGSRLNNFLASNHGERAIVFMDEFEKTHHSVHNALLIPFDNGECSLKYVPIPLCFSLAMLIGQGEYEDRRNHKMIDCSKIIWILATNAIDGTIKDFWEKNEAVLQPDYPNSKEQQQTLKNLSKEMQETFKDRFDVRPPSCLLMLHH